MIMRTATNIAMLALVGYIASTSFGLSFEDVVHAAENPASINYQAAGKSTVQAALGFREGVIDAVEGPVKSLVYSMRDTLVSNAQVFAFEIPASHTFR